MNWVEILFGWATKGYCEVTMLDSIIFVAEIMFVLLVGTFIWSLIPQKKGKRGK
jgi:hypothetical protein